MLEKEEEFDKWLTECNFQTTTLELMGTFLRKAFLDGFEKGYEVKLQYNAQEQLQK